MKVEERPRAVVGGRPCHLSIIHSEGPWASVCLWQRVGLTDWLRNTEPESHVDVTKNSSYPSRDFIHMMPFILNKPPVTRACINPIFLRATPVAYGGSQARG